MIHLKSVNQARSDLITLVSLYLEKKTSNVQIYMSQRTNTCRLILFYGPLFMFRMIVLV